MLNFPIAGGTSDHFLGGVLAAVLLALFLAALASPSPDGLKRVAELYGFLSRRENGAFAYTPFPNYSLAGVKSPIWAAGLAGLLGTLVVLGLALLLGTGLRRFAKGADMR